MKKVLSVSFSLLFATTICLSGYAQNTTATKPAKPKPAVAKAYELKFKINGLKSKDTILLANYYGDKQYLKDTAIANSKGEFTFDGKEKLPNGIYLVVLPGKQYFEVIVREQAFSMETDTKDYTKNMKVVGSVENKAFYDYLNYIVVQGKKAEQNKVLMDSAKTESDKTKYRDVLIGVEKEIIKFRKDFVKTNPTLFVSKIFNSMIELENGDIPETPKAPNGRPDSTFPFRYYKAHYWDSIDLNEDGLIRSPIFHGKLDKYIKQLTIQVPDSINKEADLIISKIKDKKGEIFKYVVWYITNQYETSQVMGMDAVFVHMAENYYLTGQAYWINEDVETKIRDRYNTLKYLLLGKLAPPLSLQDTSGKYKSFTAIKSKYTVLIFWDPNCGHCQKELPKLRDLYTESKDKLNFDVYSICTETDATPWKNFIRNNNLPWINVYDPKNESNFRKVYDVYSTPVVYILDQTKKIIAKRLGVEQLKDFFENYDRMTNKP
ncbi:MAG: redoxin domain-containing protein [Cytophagales bacterium]